MEKQYIRRYIILNLDYLRKTKTVLRLKKFNNSNKIEEKNNYEKSHNFFAKKMLTYFKKHALQ